MILENIFYLKEKEILKLGICKKPEFKFDTSTALLQEN